MKIFDSHVHFWDLSLKKHTWLLGKPESTFLGDYSAISIDYLPENLKTDAGEIQIVGFTHIQAGWDDSDASGETEWLITQQTALEMPIAIVGYADLTSNSLNNCLTAHCRYPMFRGIRQIINWHQEPFFSGCAYNIAESPSFTRGYKMLRNFNLSFDLQAYPAQLEMLFPLIEQHENIPVIIEHCGMPLFLSSSDVKKWKKILAKLSQLPNTYLKLSGLEMFNKFSDSHMSKRAILHYCLTEFGVDRCLFGSNYPVAKLKMSYQDCVADILKLGLTNDELAAVFYKNAIRAYRVD